MINESVLGQNPIEKKDLAKPSLDSNGISPIKLISKSEDSRQSIIDIRDKIASGAYTFSVDLPENISKKQFEKRLGAYSPVQGINISEEVAQDQSGAEQMAYFIPRAAAKAATEALKLPGYIQGAAEWASTGFDPKEYGNAFNNGWNVALDNLNTSLQEKGLPVYTPESVRDGNIFDKLASTSFWASEGADGVGFLVGMMAPGALLRWASLGEKIAGANKVFTAAEKLAMPANELNAVAKSAKTAATINDWSASVINTVYESATEGVSAFNDYLTDHPDDVEGAGKVASKTFLVNNAILIGPNMLNQKWLFNGFKRTESVAKGSESALAKGLGKTVSETGVGSLKATTFLDKSLNVGKILGKGVLSEGFFEEGLQYTTSEYFAKNPNRTNVGEIAEGIIKEYITDIGADTKGNTEMWSGIILGGLMGGGMSTIGGVKQANREEKVLSEYHKLLSNNFLNYSKTYKDFAKIDDKTGKPIVLPSGEYDLDESKVIAGGKQAFKNAFLRESASQAFEKGNKEAYDKFTNALHFDYMLPWLQIEGGLDLLKKHIKSIASTENQKDLERLGIETKNVTDLEKILNAKADKFQKLVDFVNDTHDINFKVNLIEGATNDDLVEFSKENKSTKLSSKLNMDYSLERINALKSELSNFGIISSTERLDDSLVKELKDNYAKVKSERPLDKTEQLRIEKAISTIENNVKLYNASAIALNDAFDNKKMQKAFDEKVTEKINTAKLIADTKANANKETVAKDFNDPQLKKLWLDNIKIEDLSFNEKTIDIWDGKKSVSTKIPGKTIQYTHRGKIKITYLDKNQKEHSVIAVVGDITKTGGMTVRTVTKNADDVDVMANRVSFLNNMTDFNHNGVNYKVVSITQEATPDQVQKESQLEATISVYEEYIQGYNDSIKDKAEKISNNIEKISDLKTKLKEFLKEHRDNLLTEKGTERRIYVGTRKEAGTVVRIYMTVAEVKNEIESLKDNNNTLRSLQSSHKERRVAFKEKLNGFKQSKEFPLTELNDLIDAVEKEEQFSLRMLDLSTQAIIEGEGLVRRTMSLLKGYHTQLAKVLGIDISDKKLGIEGLNEDEKFKVKTDILLTRVNELRSDTTGDSYIFPETEYNLAKQMEATQEKLDNVQQLLNENKEYEAKYSELYKTFKLEKAASKSQFNKIYKAYKKAANKFFKESDLYESNLIDSKKSTSMEEDFNVMFDTIGRYEPEERHPYEGFDSFLTLTSDQKYAASNPDVARWFVFVNNYAYKGIDATENPKYALKTVTYDQVTASYKLLKDKLKFWTGDKFMSYNEIQKAKDNTALIEIAKNDIKTVVVHYEEPDKIVLVSKEGNPNEASENRNFLVYSSLGLESEVRESGKERFSFKKAQDKYITEKVTEGIERDARLEEDAVKFVKDEFSKQQEAFLAFRNSVQKESVILNISGVNPGHKETEGLKEIDVLEAITEPLQSLTFITSSPIKEKNEETGVEEYADATVSISGREFKAKRGFTYLRYKNRPELIKPKTLQDTGSVNDIYNIFRYIASYKEGYEDMTEYLKQVLFMYSDNPDFRLYFRKATDESGKKIENKYSDIVFDNNHILIEDLAANRNTAEFKEFLSTKYWQFDKDLINSNANFSEFVVNSKLEKKEVVWNGHEGGYKAFLFSTKNGNKSKGLLNIKPLAKGKEKRLLLAQNPQYSNQSLNTYVRGSKEAIGEERPKGVGQVLKITLKGAKGDVIKNVVYFPEEGRMVTTAPELTDKTVLFKSSPEAKQVASKIKELLNNGSYTLDTFRDVPGIMGDAKISVELDHEIEAPSQTTTLLKEAVVEEKIIPVAEEKIDSEKVKHWESLATENPDMAGDYLATHEGNLLEAQEEAWNDLQIALKGDVYSKIVDETESATKEQQDYELKWFKETFPNFPLEVVEGLIDNKDWGQLVNASKVLISDLSAEGIVYHEAFHTWDIVFNTDENRRSLYNEVRKRLDNDKLTNVECEEFLAEDFRDFMLQGKDYVFNKGQEVQKSFFQKIYNYLKDIFQKLFNINIEKDSEDIIKNAYINIVTNTFTNPLRTKIEQSFSRIAEVKPVQQLVLVKDMNFRFFKMLINDVNKGGDLIFNLEYKPETLYKELEKQYVALKINASQLKKTFKLNPILEYWPKFVQEHKLFLTQYKINILDSLDEDDVLGRNADEYNESFTHSIKDRAPSPIRLLIGSLPKVRREGKELITETDSKYLTKSNVEFNKIMNLLSNELSKISTPEGIMNKIKELSEQKPELELLYKYLGGNISADQMSLTQLRLFGQFYNTFSSNKNKAILLTMNNDGTLTYKNMVDETDKDVTKQEWITNAQELAGNKKSKYVKKVNGEYIIDRKLLLTDLKSMVSNKNWDSILSGLGITFTRTNTSVAKNYLNRLREQLQVLPEDIEIDINSLYDRNIIQNQVEMDSMAEYASKSILNDVDLMYFNQNGDMEWSITRNSHISEVTNRLNEYSDAIKSNDNTLIPDNLKSLMPFNGKEGNLYTLHSLYWDLISSGKYNIEFSVIKGIRSQGDNGRELDKANYADYKMSTFEAILHNIIPFEAGDRGPKYAFKIQDSNYGVSEDAFVDSMMNYLYDEVITSFAVRLKSKQFGYGLTNYTKNAENLRTFDFLFDKKYNKDSYIETLEDFLESKNIKNINFEKLKEYTQEYIDSNSNNIKSTMKNFIIETNNATKESLKESKLILSKHNNTWDIPGLSTETIEKNFGGLDGNKRISDARLNHIIMVHSYNYFIGKQEQLKIFVGDLAGYANIQDFYKRTTSSASTRLQIANDDRTIETLNTIYPKVNGYTHSKNINKVIISPVKYDASEDLQSFNKAYKNMDIIDGQMWGTLDFIRGIHARNGNWTDEHETTFQYEMQNLALRVLKNKELSKIWTGASEEMFTTGVFSRHTNGIVPKSPMFKGNVIKIGETPMGKIPAIKPLGAGFNSSKELNIGVMDVNKMSVAPMFPSVLQDRELKFLLSMMEYDIDKIGDPKTEKSEYYSNDLNIENDDLINKKTKLTQLSYNDYGIQSDIQQEEKGKVTDSTQKTCVIYNDCFNNGFILPDFKDLEDNIQERDELLNEITKRNREEVIQELGLTLDETTGVYHLPVENKDKFKQLLTNMFVQRLMPDNLIEGLGYVLDSKEKVLDLFTDSSKVEQILTAFIKNNVIKRKVNGEMYVQEASYLYGQGLKFYEKSDVQTSRAEVMIPIPTKLVKWVESIGGIDELNKRLSEGKLPKEMIEFTANRIPTASINTVEAFIVKRFLPNYVGARIILPNEIVAKTSSDYDIDKLTCYFNNLKTDENGDIILKGGYPTYNKYEKEKDNSKKAIENRLNELTAEALLHPKRYYQLLEPHESVALKKLAEKLYSPSTYLEKLESEEQNKYSSSVQWWYNVKKAQDFWQGKQGVAYAASNNTVNSQMQQFPVNIQDDIIPLFFEGQQKKSGEKYTSGHTKDFDNYNTASNYGQFLVAFVDAAKDPFVLKLNASPKTFSIYSFLNKFGISSGVGLEQIATFITSPIIKEYLNAIDIRKSIFAQHNQYANKKTFDIEKNKYISDRWYDNNIGWDSNIVEDLLTKRIGDTAMRLPKTYDETVASSVQKYLEETNVKQKEKLRAEIQRKINFYNYQYLTTDDMRKNKDKGRTAVQILDNFLMYQTLAGYGIGLNSILRPYAATSYRKSLNGIEAKISKIDEVKEQGLFDPDTIDNHLNGGSLKEMTKTYQESLDMLSWTTLTRKYPELHELFKANFIDKYSRLSGDKAEDIFKTAKNQFISFLFSYINGENISNVRNKYREMFIGENSMPRRLQKMKQEGKINSELFNILKPVIKSWSADIGRTRENDYIATYNKKYGISEENMFTSVFEEMFQSKDPEIVKFASDLFEFSVYQNGMDYSYINYMKIIPNSIFVNTLDKIINNISFEGKTIQLAFNSFIDQFYRNNYEDNDIVYRHNESVFNVETYENDETELSQIARPRMFGTRTKVARHEYITIRYNKIASKQRKVNRKQGLKSATEYLLYHREGLNSDGKNYTYKLVNKLGDGIRFKEYYPALNGKEVRSILKANSYEGVIEPKGKIDLTNLNKKKKVDENTKIENDIKKIFYQLDELETDKSIEEVDNAMKDFLDAIGVTYKSVNSIKDHTGSIVPAIAVSKLSEMTLEVIEGKTNVKTLPEEASHFYVSLLDENNGLYKSMYNNIINYPIYAKTVELYKERYNNDEKKIREEAIGKLIADRIVKGVDTSLPIRQQEQVNNWWIKLWQYIKNLFIKTNIDPYTKSAYDILTRNVTELTSPKLERGDQMFNKQEVIEQVISHLNESDKEVMRKELTSIGKDEFNSMVKKAGFNSLGNYWTPSSVSSLYQLQSTKEQWNELPFTAKGLYKYDYQKTVDAGEKAFSRYSDTFGRDNVTYIPLQDSNFKVKIAIKKPMKSGDISEKIIHQEDISIENMKEFAKAPVQFNAEQLLNNFATYFPDYNWLEDSEKLNMINSIENGDMEISCSF